MSFLSPTLKLENLAKEPQLVQDHLPEENRYAKGNFVARWCVPINGRMYRIELDHGTTSGRRMVWINGKEIIRRDWMFKLVGEDSFKIDKARCIIRVDPAPGFKYQYSLYIDGQPYKQYTKELARTLRTWITVVDEVEYRIVLELDSLNIFLNDKLRDEMGEFVDGGTDTYFEENGVKFQLCARSSGNGIRHSLKVNGEVIPEVSLINLDEKDLKPT
ncbi:fas apoptotic inhibitory molecule 1 [Eupeodes corollae]|uniref:fas apoptotic inhibitory molecule 1 n=1 Tax=Eupeodes corollae TaxID=290404 RepID=UPI002491A3AA|nr:fas apoptotic inhibitory molecule 1 [Eupeodes corollae]XP_055908158.1 fas apoptotic inhibitory molecule 1 [Eupeodes corollae]